MIEMSVTEVRKNLCGAIHRVLRDGDRIVLTRRGKPLAAMVPVEDLEALVAMEDKSDLAAARKAKREKGKAIPWEKAKKMLRL